MRKQFSSNRLGFSSWRTALIGIVVIKAVLSLAVKPGSFVFSYSGISYFILLLLATSFAIRNGIQKTLGSRPFWVFVAIAYGLWGLDQGLYLYYELGLHVAVPDNSIADTLLFFHIVPLMAAVASLPHRKVPDRKHHPAILNSLLILFFWVFLYGYIVFPYQYLYSTSSYGLRFDILYLLENLVLISAAVILTRRTQAPWNSIYVHLVVASTVYALSSAVANLAIDSGGYVNGKLYGLGLTASVCWFAWIPLQARQVAGAEVTAGRADGSHGSRSSVWAMVMVVMISIPIVWELLQRNENPGLRTVRLVVAVAAIVCLASTAYITEYFARRELASYIGLANEALRTSEERLRLAQWAAHVGTFDLDLRTGVYIWTPETEALYGLPPGGFEGTLTAFENLIHPDDRKRVIELTHEMMRTEQPAEAEYRVVWPDGSVHWIASRGQVFMDDSGEPSRMLGASIDITERKRSEEALSGMTRKLIEAQEQERARIGRELHDDINQRIAMLSLELEQLQQNPSDVQSRAQELRKRMAELSNDVQALSHDLHSSKLEYLGVVAGIKSWCKEFSGRQKVEIDFKADAPSAVPLDVGLSLFRVLQEALQNGLKHSGARRIEVQLRQDSEALHLVVRDSGKGFDVEAASQGKGLGLTSMRERVRLVNGTIAIDSKPMGGTTIHVSVPLKSQHARRAVG